MADPLVLINTFEVSHEDAERFIAAWGRGGSGFIARTTFPAGSQQISARPPWSCQFRWGQGTR
jgi:hypothetical protein